MPRKPLISKQKLAIIIERTPDQKITLKSLKINGDLRVLKNDMLKIVDEIPEENQIAGFIQSTDWHSKTNLETLKKRKKPNG